MTGTNEHNIWKDIRRRCYFPACAAYIHYGARGIKMSDEWRTDFMAFYRDMGLRPSKEMTVERYDNDGDYCKENCGWETRQVQGRNTRWARYFAVWEGQRLHASQIAKILKCSPSAIVRRIQKGLPLDLPVKENMPDRAVAEIKWLLKNSHIPKPKIALRYGVTSSRIQQIAMGISDRPHVQPCSPYIGQPDAV